MTLLAQDIATAGAWSALEPPLRPEIARALETDLGFAQMTPVQAATVPQLLRFKDAVVEAVTGSGKTLAFLVPVVHMLLSLGEPLGPRDVGAVVLTPTRELGQQVHGVLGKLLKAVARHRTKDGWMPTFGLYIGGKSTVAADVRRFAEHSSHIVIGTPGRVSELLKERNAVRTGSLVAAIFDEADRLFDLGFVDAMQTILALIPKQRRTGLFSATLVDGMDDFIRAGLRNPVRIVVRSSAASSSGDSGQRVPTTLSIYHVTAAPADRLAALGEVLRLPRYAGQKAIVYMGTCAAVDYLYAALKELGEGAVLPGGAALMSLHGKMNPKRREAVFARFVAAPAPCVLLTTDLAARGLDICDVGLVVQLDAPQDPKAFAHRCGRTARAGRAGEAVVFLAPEESAFVDFLQLQQVPISAHPELPEAAAAPPDLFERLRRVNMATRDMHERSVQAFVAYLRFYQEHQLAYIFHRARLDVVGVARLFGLLRLPRGPELAALRASKSPQLASWVDWDGNVHAIPYADASREAARQARLLRDASLGQSEGVSSSTLKVSKESSGAWSRHRDAKVRRQERRAKRVRKRAARTSAA